MSIEFNIANSIFPGLNSKGGIFVCGYEWGYSKKDEEEEKLNINQVFIPEAEATFSNKSPRYGDRAFRWRYDNRIVSWFELLGHPLSREGLGGDFEKCLIQTNWCNTQDRQIEGSYYEKLSAEDQVENFIAHVAEYQPQLILFFGSAMIDILQTPWILDRFCTVAGPVTKPLEKIAKAFSGRRFRVGFQSFEKCQIVSLPHPTSSRGLSNAYIELFKPEIGPILERVKISKGIVSAI